jgi:hypothetical protein
MDVSLSYVALIISAAAFVFGVFSWRDRKRQDKRDLLLQLHERLHDVKLARGRRILYHVCSVEDARVLFHQRPEDYDSANRALWMLDIAALYVEQGYIDRRMFMELWEFVYDGIFEHAQYFINERLTRSGMASRFAWPHFQSLATQVANRNHRGQ